MAYQGLSQEAMKRRQEMKDRRYGSGKGYLNHNLYKAFLPREGKNKVRILPPAEYQKLEWFGIEVRFHRNVGLNKDMFLCLRLMNIGACPICELQTPELWQAEPEVAKTYYPDHRVLIWVQDLMSDTPQQVLLWSAPITLAYEIHNAAENKETGQFIDLMDPRTGPAIFFERTGKGLKTKYQGVQAGASPIPVSDAALNVVLPFDQLVIVPDYAEVKASMEYAADDKPSSPPPATPPPGKYAAPPADAEQEVEQEVEDTSVDCLEGMDRSELKAFKVKWKGEVPALQFPIVAKWTDDQLRDELRKALTSAGREDLLRGAPAAEVETEDEGPAPPPAAPDPREDEIARKRAEVRDKLNAAIQGQRGKK